MVPGKCMRAMELGAWICRFAESSFRREGRFAMSFIEQPKNVINLRLSDLIENNSLAARSAKICDNVSVCALAGFECSQRQHVMASSPGRMRPGLRVCETFLVALWSNW